MRAPFRRRNTTIAIASAPSKAATGHHHGTVEDGGSGADTGVARLSGEGRGAGADSCGAPAAGDVSGLGGSGGAAGLANRVELVARGCGIRSAGRWRTGVAVPLGAGSVTPGAGEGAEVIAGVAPGDGRGATGASLSTGPWTGGGAGDGLGGNW